MLRRGQQCGFCRIESRGKNNVPRITSIDFIFPAHVAFLYSIQISLLVFKNYSRSCKMSP